MQTLQQGSPPIFYVEVEKSISQRLSDLADKEHIPLKILTSRLIMHMLIYHRKEVSEIITLIRRPEAW